VTVDATTHGLVAVSIIGSGLDLLQNLSVGWLVDGSGSWLVNWGRGRDADRSWLVNWGWDPNGSRSWLVNWGWDADGCGWDVRLHGSWSRNHNWSGSRSRDHNWSWSRSRDHNWCWSRLVDRSGGGLVDRSRSWLVNRSWGRRRVVVTQMGDITIGAGQNGKGNNQEFLKSQANQSV